MMTPKSHCAISIPTFTIGVPIRQIEDTTGASITMENQNSITSLMGTQFNEDLEYAAIGEKVKFKEEQYLNRFHAISTPD
jgi:hypothetical protein